MARDITKALALVDRIQQRHPIPDASSADFDELRKLLKDLDARTGTHDPRVKSKAKKAAKKGSRR